MPDLSGMPCWFLGANAPKGYFSRFDQLFSASPKGRCFLIKGGPGTGKSTMLKKIAAVLKEKDPGTELIFCSADIDSLDAVITSDGMFSAADATLPHAVEPKYPGVYETVVSLSDCWDEKILRDEDSRATVDLMFASKKYDFDWQLDITEIDRTISDMVELHTNNLVKRIASATKRGQKSIDKYIAKYEDLD